MLMNLKIKQVGDISLVLLKVNVCSTLIIYHIDYCLWKRWGGIKSFDHVWFIQLSMAFLINGITTRPVQPFTKTTCECALFRSTRLLWMCIQRKKLKKWSSHRLTSIVATTNQLYRTDESICQTNVVMHEINESFGVNGSDSTE